VGVGRGPGPLRNTGIGSPGCGHPDKDGAPRSMKMGTTEPGHVRASKRACLQRWWRPVALVRSTRSENPVTKSPLALPRPQGTRRGRSS